MQGLLEALQVNKEFEEIFHLKDNAKKRLLFGSTQRVRTLLKRRMPGTAVESQATMLGIKYKLGGSMYSNFDASDALLVLQRRGAAEPIAGVSTPLARWTVVWSYCRRLRWLRRAMHSCSSRRGATEPSGV